MFIKSEVTNRLGINETPIKQSTLFNTLYPARKVDLEVYIAMSWYPGSAGHSGHAS